MTTTLFQSPEDIAVPVANDVPAGVLRATVQTLPAMSPIVAARNEGSELILFVEEGLIDLSINGMDGYLTEGEFARIAPHAHFAYRNKDRTPAVVLSVPVVRIDRTLRLVKTDSNAA
jgi:hypothetical protein